MLSESWQPIADTLGFKSEEEMLKHLYLSQSFSLLQMKQVLGYSTYAIRRRLIEFGIPLRSRGGPDNRLGRRKLKDISDSKLLTTKSEALAEEFKVHVSTVFAEKRFRAAEKERFANALLSYHASRGNAQVRELLQELDGTGTIHEE